jgi:hypothetical protein
MSVNKTISDENSKIKIIIKGRFDFSLHQHVRDSYVHQVY